MTATAILYMINTMPRYKILKFFLGILSLLVFFNPLAKNGDDEEKQKPNESGPTALQSDDTGRNINENMHFFVSCGGFIS